MDIEEFLKEAIKEDIGRGDLFSRVFNSKKIEAFIKAKSDGVLAGRLYLDKLAKLYELDFKWNFDDSCEFKKGDILVEIKGDSNILLSLERVILNILLHASSIATKTKQYVDELKGFNTILLDTRKTRPLLRNFEKYAVRCGGGVNHRMGLDDALMLKDTHLKSIDNLEEFMKNVRKKIPFTSKVEIECESFEDAKRAFRVGADIVMCDNMSVDEIKKVVEYKNRYYPHILIEASGNITLENIKEIAKSGVDAISTGSTMHQACWIDISMKVKG